MANTARDEAEKARGGCYGPRPALASAPTPAEPLLVQDLVRIGSDPAVPMAYRRTAKEWVNRLAELQRLAVPLDAVVVTRQAYEQLRTGLVAAPTPADLPMPGVTWEPSQKLVAPTPTEPLNTILQAIVQHCSDANMTFDDLRVLNRLIEKVEQAAAPTPAEPLDVDRMREAHRIAYRDGTDIAVEYNRLAAARPDTPASAEQPGRSVYSAAEVRSLLGQQGFAKLAALFPDRPESEEMS